LLAVDDRFAWPEMQTMRALLDRSYDRLPDNERRLFSRLSVFAGGFDLDAAEQVCVSPPLSPADVLDALTVLIDRSFVVTDESTGYTRYRLFEILREYARDRAREKAEGLEDIATTSRRHAEYFLGFAKTAQAQLTVPDEAQWSERIEMELGNLQAAFRWALTQSGSSQFALELGIALERFWLRRNLLTERRSLLNEALAMPDEHPVTDALVAALHAAGILASSRGDAAEAKRLFTMCNELRSELGASRELASPLSGLAEILQKDGERAVTQDRENRGRVTFPDAEPRSD